MIDIIKVTIDDVPALSAFASEIVKDHFDPIIGSAQNDYMIARFQSVEAIGGQLQSGYNYYWVMLDQEPAGFMAFFPRDGRMYLSKFYTHKGFRGRGLATRMLAFIEERAKADGLPSIFLNVNRGNDDVIAVYKHLGFHIAGEEVNDIGGGFVMDDYVMEKCL